jgi:hypothetical protein
VDYQKKSFPEQEKSKIMSLRSGAGARGWGGVFQTSNIQKQKEK